MKINFMFSFILFFSVVDLKAQDKRFDSTSLNGSYKRQNEVVNRNKVSGKGQTFEYIEDKVSKSGIESSDYKHSLQKQTGGVLPTKPVEKNLNGFFSNRNYKRQF